MMPRVVLASASPRRRQLLSCLMDDFIVDPAAVDETGVSGATPEEFARNCARHKARVVAARRVNGELVLGADTIVVLDGEIFGKPAGPDEARSMLTRLGGREHEVIGGVALCRPGSGYVRE